MNINEKHGQMIGSLVTKVIKKGVNAFGAKKRLLISTVATFLEQHKKFVLMEYQASIGTKPYNGFIADSYAKAQKEFNEFIEKY